MTFHLTQSHGDPARASGKCIVWHSDAISFIPRNFAYIGDAIIYML